jgi:YegS/Rv2252/BmrU family lipid kinase
MKHIFVVNPNAGKGKNKAMNVIVPKVKALCEKYGLKYEIYPTKAKGDGIRFVKERASTGEEIRFYACGGDGTLYEVVNGAYGFDNVELTVVPLGSGNDFVRYFGTKEMFLDLDDLYNGKVCELDVIKCGDEIAINQCSMGMDAEVCAKQGEIKKLPLVTGEGAYGIGCIYAIATKTKNRFTLTIDDGEPVTLDALFCFIGNASYYGGGYRAAPLALPDDGLLDFVVVESVKSKIELLKMLKPYKNGQHLDWEITHFKRGKNLKVHAAVPAAINVDGECRFVTDAEFQIAEKAVKFLVPASSDFLKK